MFRYDLFLRSIPLSYLTAVERSLRETDRLLSSCELHEHRWDRDDFVVGLLRNARKAADLKGLRQPLFVDLLPSATDARFLEDTFCLLARRNGTAPGNDGRTYESYGRQARFKEFGELRERVQSGAFQTAGFRCVQGPCKSGRTDRRALRLPTVMERTLQKAILRLIGPSLDADFLAFSYGYRLNVGHHDAIERLRTEVDQRKRYFFRPDDIRSAFDRIPINRMTEIAALYLRNCSAARLMIALTAYSKKRGLVQGGPLSPLLLNLYLHHVHDLKLASSDRVSVFRYADDFAFIGDDPTEVADAWSASEKRLRASATLFKASSRVVDLRRETTEWLGFEIGARNGRLRVHVGQKRFAQLNDTLDLCLRRPNGSYHARKVIDGWLSDVAPHTKPSADSCIAKAIALHLKHRGISEASSCERMRRRLKELRELHLEKASKHLSGSQ